MSSVIDLIETPDAVHGPVVPPVPESIEETGIPPTIIEHLLMKYLYFRGEIVGRDLASLIGFKFSLIDETLETFKRQHYVGVKKSLGMGNMSGIFFLPSPAATLPANSWKITNTPVRLRCRCINILRSSAGRSCAKTG